MKKIHWILQQNLIKEETLQVIKNILTDNNISFDEVKIIPFSIELPDIKLSGEINVFYGSTTLILNAYKKYGEIKGLFYNSQSFNMQNYIQHWGVKMLNSDSKILTFNEIIKLNLAKDTKWFVRPIEDDKSFSGKIMSVEDIENIEKQLTQSNNPYLTVSTLVAISEVKEIKKEWRMFIVNKKVVSACRYTLNGHLSVDHKDISEQLINFAEKCCCQYSPSDVFVMDIALFNDEFRIVECNCFNDSGFYNHDIEAIINEVNRFLNG